MPRRAARRGPRSPRSAPAAGSSRAPGSVLRLRLRRRAGRRRGFRWAATRTLVVGVGDRERVGQRLRLFGLVLDFEEDAEVGGAGGRRLLADQVGGVLVVVGVEEAGEDDVVLDLAELHRLTLDDLLLVADVAASGGGEAAPRRRGRRAAAGRVCGGWSSARGSLLVRDAGRVAIAPGDGHAAAGLAGLELSRSRRSASRQPRSCVEALPGEHLERVIRRVRGLGPVGDADPGQPAGALEQPPRPSSSGSG